MECPHFSSCHISFDPNTETVDLERCCYYEFPILKIPYQAWLAIPNKLQFIKQNFLNVWPNSDSQLNCQLKKQKCVKNSYTFSLKSIEVSIDRACSADCVFCSQKNFREIVKNKKLESTLKKVYFETLLNIAQNLKNQDNSIVIRLTDRGEPLFYTLETSSILEMLEAAEKVDKIRISTNGLALLNNKLFSQIKASKKIELCCSINAFSEEVHFERMKISGFYEIIDKVNQLPNSHFSYVFEDRFYEDIIKNYTSFRQLSKKDVWLIPYYNNATPLLYSVLEKGFDGIRH